jgi:hypothetical protein
VSEPTPEEIFMKCPFCGDVILKSATDEEIDQWMEDHIMSQV